MEINSLKQYNSVLSNVNKGHHITKYEIIFAVKMKIVVMINIAIANSLEGMVKMWKMMRTFRIRGMVLCSVVHKKKQQKPCNE